MPKTSSKCLNSLLDDDGMKDRQLVARASVDEYDTVKISNLLNKQESAPPPCKQKAETFCYASNSENTTVPNSY